jgi:hypothetical protein
VAVTHRAQAFDEELHRVVQDMSDRRYTLQVGVARLAATERAQDQGFLRCLHYVYPEYTVSEALAAVLINHITMATADSLADQQIVLELTEEFHVLYRMVPHSRVQIPPLLKSIGENLAIDRYRRAA